MKYHEYLRKVEKNVNGFVKCVCFMFIYGLIMMSFVGLFSRFVCEDITEMPPFKKSIFTQLNACSLPHL